MNPEQDRRIERAANAEGITQQSFMIGAIMRGVEAVESRREQQRERHKRNDRDYRRDEPMGLGLFRDKPREAPSPETPQQSQVVVNVGKQDGGADDIVSRLVDDVTNGPEYSRDDRMQTALGTIRRLARNETEREEMTQRLKDAVAARAKAKSPSFWDEMKELIR